MFWPSNISLFMSPDEGGGGTGDGDTDDNPADGFNQSTLDFLKSKNIDPAKASSTQIAEALMVEIRAKDKKLGEEIKGRQGERQKRQELQRQIDTPKSLQSILDDSNTDATAKTEIQALINKAAEASDFQESVVQLVDNGTISSEMFDAMQAGPKATAAVFKAIGTGSKTQDSSGGKSDEDKMFDRFMEKLGNVGKDLHQNKDEKPDGKPKSLLDQYRKENPKVRSYLDKLKKGGAKKE